MDSSLINTISIVLGIVSIAISLSAIGISWLLYTKSDSLNKEMLKFLSEIKTYTSSLYADSFGLVKKSYEKFIDNGFGTRNGYDLDNVVKDIANDVAKKVEEKLSKELSKIASGDKLRGDEINRLKSDVQNLIKKIPSEVAQSKGERASLLERRIAELIENSPGLTASQIVYDKSLCGDFDNDWSEKVDILNRMTRERKINLTLPSGTPKSNDNLVDPEDKVFLAHP
jgi:hypothetical protein